jgi:tol-pal system protein YbgF
MLEHERMGARLLRERGERPGKRSMTTKRTVLAAAAIVAAGLIALPATGEAAWWKFGRDKVERDADGGVAVAQAEESDRLARIENSLRNLTGQVEQLTFQLRQLEDQLKRAQEDTEFRFKDLETGQAGGGNKVAKAPSPNRPVRQAIASPPEEQPADQEPPAERLSDVPAPPAADDQAGEVVLGQPPESIGTLIIDAPPPPGGPDQPIDLSPAARGEDPGVAPDQTVSLTPTGDPAMDFKQAYDLTVRGEYDVAEAAFRQFLATYPNDPRAAEAQYWLGDSLFSRGKYGEAAAEFRIGYKKYPQSPKGAETLLKIGMTATATEDFTSACKIYSQLLKQYPQASNALRQRVKVEQASAGC